MRYKLASSKNFAGAQHLFLVRLAFWEPSHLVPPPTLTSALTRVGDSAVPAHDPLFTPRQPIPTDLG